MIEALVGLGLTAIMVVGGLIVMLGRLLTSWMRAREAKYERMAARRGVESIAPPVAELEPWEPPGRRKRRTLAERVFVTDAAGKLRQARDTDPDES